jgi:hypothetical protein
MAKPRKRFVVGYSGEHQVVYGPQQFTNTNAPRSVTTGHYVQRMTRWQAERAVSELRGRGATIYELVPVKQ